MCLDFRDHNQEEIKRRIFTDDGVGTFYKLINVCFYKYDSYVYHRVVAPYRDIDYCIDLSTHDSILYSDRTSCKLTDEEIETGLVYNGIHVYTHEGISSIVTNIEKYILNYKKRHNCVNPTIKSGVCINLSGTIYVRGYSKYFIASDPTEAVFEKVTIPAKQMEVLSFAIAKAARYLEECHVLNDQ